MTITEAKKIIADLMEWQMFSQGILDEIPKSFDESLTISELLEANTKVKNWNKRQRESKKSGGFSQQMVFADRALAGIYCCLNFPVSSEAHIIVNMVGCATIQMNFNPESEEE